MSDVDAESEYLLGAYEVLAESVRRLIDVTIRTEAAPESVFAAAQDVDRIADGLGTRLMPGSFGVRDRADGQAIASGNVVIGVRNPVAPPLVVHHEPDGSVWSEFILGAAYEGPPGHVHGGVCALVLDHVLGATAHKPGRPAFTGTLTMRYLRPTRLGPLRAEGRIERVEGAKTFAVGHIADRAGATVEAHGVFIHPKGARNAHV